jgi:hypothetical protein
MPREYYLGLYMAEFKSWDEYWSFKTIIRSQSRYGLTKDVQTFLETVLATSKSREVTIPNKQIFWRAQLGCDTIERENEHTDNTGKTVKFTVDEDEPYAPQRMKPQKYFAKEGRANPKGIPYLYLSTHKDTAMSEIRPWLGEIISLAQFRTVRELKVIDCSNKGSVGQIIYFEQPSPKEREEAVWRDIDRAFSTPLTDNDLSAEYAPTQVIADMFKQNGFDGIVYKSSLNEDGFNITLFNINDANLINCSLSRVEKIQYEFQEEGHTYYLKRSTS